MTRTTKIVGITVAIVLVALAIWLVYFGGTFGYMTGQEITYP